MSYICNSINRSFDMAIFQIFTKRQSRQFYIPPRYSDPLKDKRDEREARIKHELGISDDTTETSEYKSAISGAFRSRLSPRFHKKDEKSNYSIKIILLVFIMAMAAYIYLKLT